MALSVSVCPLVVALVVGGFYVCVVVSEHIPVTELWGSNLKNSNHNMNLRCAFMLSSASLVKIHWLLQAADISQEHEENIVYINI